VERIFIRRVLLVEGDVAILEDPIELYENFLWNLAKEVLTYQ
jgi:hypothetical protein